MSTTQSPATTIRPPDYSANPGASTLCSTGRWHTFGGWLVVALLGNIATLAMIDAGPLIRYQHYHPLDRLTSTPGLVALGVLIVQSIVVAIGLRRYWRSFSRWIGSHLGVGRVLGGAVALGFCSAALSPDLRRYAGELAFATCLQTLAAATTFLVAASIPNQAIPRLRRAIDKLLGADSPATPARFDRAAIIASLWVTAVAAALSLAVYERHPHVPDEVVYYFQARYFANGQLTVPAPPVPEAFSFYLIPHRSPQWYSPFPPGWPAVLAVGIPLGLSWLVNPVLAGIDVLLAFYLTRELYGRRTARLAALLLALSPWHIFLGMSFMSHSLTLACGAMAALGLLVAQRTEHARWALASGLATSFAFLVRPLDGVIIAGVVGLTALASGIRSYSMTCRIGFGLGVAFFGVLGLQYNRLITGHFTTLPLAAYYDDYFGPKVNALGFGPERGFGWALDAFPGHSPLEALVNASLNAFSLNTELFGWCAGSLFFVVALLISRGGRRRDSLMVIVVLMIVAVYSLYWYSGGPEFGARYWYLAIVPLVVLTVRGIEYLERAMDGTGGNGARVLVGVGVLCTLALLTFIPWRAVNKYYHFLRMRPDVRQLAVNHDFQHSLVFVRGDWHPDYMSAWTYNPLDWETGPIYAWDRSAELRARVLAAYPGRPVWVIDGPSVTGAGFHVVEQPREATNAATPETTR